MTMPLPSGGYVATGGYTRRSRFGERPGPLVARLILLPSQPMGMAPSAGDPAAQIPVDPQAQSAPSIASTDQSELESSAPSAD